MRDLTRGREDAVKALEYLTGLLQASLDFL